MSPGNVAHDLRTPLQAFQSEIELLRETIKNDDNTPEKQKSQLDSIKQLGLICHFMNMTINRSIDFTKASSGIKLNPSIESVNFSDTMSWAVGCMVTTQEEGTVPIELEPIPAAIHNHIYTDKQWLMENMLCLLSNAQKFTTEGAITIRCALHTKFEGSVVRRSRSPDGTSIASVSSRVSVSSAKKYSISEHNGDNGEVHIGRSRGELSSWRERVSDFVVDLESGSVSFSDETPAPSEVCSRMLMIVVEDSGIGITKENRDKLFQPFMQVWVQTCVVCTVARVVLMPIYFFSHIIHYFSFSLRLVSV
jgi:signal transduction histidine kinase